MDFFAYVSRSKVSQLHDQLKPRSVSEWKQRKSTTGEGQVDGGVAALFGWLKANASVKASRGSVVETTESQSTIQKLRDVLAYIEQNKKVLDLNELCERSEGKQLDAFAYAYSGNFYVEADVSADDLVNNIIQIPHAAAERSDGIAISQEHLIDPGRAENSFKEYAEDGRKITSRICVISSKCANKRIVLSCSLKYFSEMGFSSNNEEIFIEPHSGNYHFFEGEYPARFKALIFLTGIDGNTVMGTPLFLIHSQDPNLVL